uniref:Putative secreted protein n=1 Tax=Amblyomma triste TaxID=251400 RepID=A0A023FZM0_AMBTT
MWVSMRYILVPLPSNISRANASCYFTCEFEENSTARPLVTSSYAVIFSPPLEECIIDNNQILNMDI